MTELPKPPETITLLSKQGLVEIYNIHTGELLCIQTSYRDLLRDKFDNLVEIITEDGKTVYIERGIDPSLVYRKKLLEFTPTLGDLFCERIAMGSPILTTCEDLAIPYSLYTRWKRENEQFRNSLEQAKKDAARLHYDLALEKAERSYDHKLQVETHKWAAKVSSPEEFGDKTKISGDPDAPLTFLLDTGIRRAGDPGYVEPVVDIKAEDVKTIGDGETSVDYTTA